MTRESNEIEQALSRTVRGSLDRFQRTADELHHALNDLVSACSSARVANALPSMMRAQMAAASLAASLEALSRFVTLNLPPALAAEPATRWADVPLTTESPVESAASSAAPAEATQPSPSEAVAQAPVPEVSAEAPAPAPSVEAPQPSPSEVAAQAVSDLPLESAPEQHAETVASLSASELLLASELASEGLRTETAGAVEFTEFTELPAVADAPLDEPLPSIPEPGPEFGAGNGFEVSGLPAEMQELHRRANRVAKVSMQDIKLLRPEDVRLGQEHRDICYRLRDDLERAHKEYDRRFQTILGHPIDYFYDWLVEILANGDPQLLGDYPYPTAAMRR